jgi:hypothetical protein
MMGFFAIGWQDDAPGPFESRSFALAVAAGQLRVRPALRP